METNHQTDTLRTLRLAGEMEDNSLDCGAVALAMGALERPQIDLRPYREHLDALVDEVREQGAGTLLDDQLRALRHVLVVRHKYQDVDHAVAADDHVADDPGAANLIHVIDRRRGVPVAIGLLYLHVATQLGWSMMGIDYAGHFLLRLCAEDGAVIIDPARAGQTCSADYLRNLGHDAQDDDEADLDEGDEDLAYGADADESHVDYAVAMTRREVLLRLQNNLKRRLLARDKLDGAISIVQGMILIAPRREPLWRELGYLQSERGSLRAAITALEVVHNLLDEPADMQQTQAMLRQLRWQLN